MKTKIFSFLVLSIILCVVIFPSLPVHASTVENRYFGQDLVLDTTKVGVQGENSKTAVGVGGYLGIRVFKVKDSTETEITAGTPVAQIPCNDGDVKQRKSNTWDCPETTDFDFIRVKVYCKIGSQAWVLMDTWNTESMSGKKLDAATWTVYYVEDCSVNTHLTPFRTTITFYYDGTNDSEIDNFTWTPAVSKSWNTAETWRLNIYTLKWFLTESWRINSYTLNWFNVESWMASLHNYSWFTTEVWKTDLHVLNWFASELWKINLHNYSWFNIETWKLNLHTLAWYPSEIWNLSLHGYEWFMAEAWKIATHAFGWFSAEVWQAVLHTVGWYPAEMWLIELSLSIIDSIAFALGALGFFLSFISLLGDDEKTMALGATALILCISGLAFSMLYFDYALPIASLGLILALASMALASTKKD